MKFTLKSKTHIFSAIVGALGALQGTLVYFEIYIPTEVYGLITASIGAGIYFFRNITTQSIEDK